MNPNLGGVPAMSRRTHCGRGGSEREGDVGKLKQMVSPPGAEPPVEAPPTGAAMEVDGVECRYV